MSEQSPPESYTEALEELEELLDELEAADVDVDLLSQRVARGVELIRFCRARLEVVTEDVDGVVAELIALDGASKSNSTNDSTANSTDDTEAGSGDNTEADSGDNTEDHGADDDEANE